MRISIIICVVICGLCLGGLSGLTTAPVIQNTISVLLTLIISILSVISGLKFSEDQLKAKLLASLKNISLVPVTLFLVGYIIGACGGIFTRTNDLLGTRPQIAYKKWGEFGITKKGYLNYYYKQLENPTTGKGIPGELFGSEATICEVIKNKHGEDLRAELNLNLEYFDKSLQDRLRPLIARGDSLELELTKNSLCE